MNSKNDRNISHFLIHVHECICITTSQLLIIILTACIKLSIHVVICSFYFPFMFLFFVLMFGSIIVSFLPPLVQLRMYYLSLLPKWINSFIRSLYYPKPLLYVLCKSFTLFFCTYVVNK